jgi:aspartate 1-decarboxylase
MFLKIMKSKIHRATVTDARLHYPGSLGIDADLMKKAGIVPYEAVTVANLANGSRLETYVIEAEAGSGRIEILGAAAQLVKTGDLVIIFSFGFYTPEEARMHKPKVLVLDENNKVKNT